MNALSARGWFKDDYLPEVTAGTSAEELQAVAENLQVGARGCARCERLAHGVFIVNTIETRKEQPRELEKLAPGAPGGRVVSKVLVAEKNNDPRRHGPLPGAPRMRNSRPMG